MITRCQYIYNRLASRNIADHETLNKAKERPKYYKDWLSWSLDSAQNRDSFRMNESGTS